MSSPDFCTCPMKPLLSPFSIEKRRMKPIRIGTRQMSDSRQSYRNMNTRNAMGSTKDCT